MKRQPTVTVPNDEQIAKIRNELVTAVRTCTAAWLGVVRARREMAPGYPATSGAGGSTGDISDRTGELATGRLVGADDPDDPDARIVYPTVDPSQTAGDWLVRWQRLLHEARSLEALALVLVPPRPDPERDDSGVRNCEACSKPVTNTAKDRLKSGFCETCYKAWKRAKRPDRAGFIRHRQAERVS